MFTVSTRELRTTQPRRPRISSLLHLWGADMMFFFGGDILREELWKDSSQLLRTGDMFSSTLIDISCMFLFGGGSCNRFEYATICERRFWTHHEKSLFLLQKTPKKSVDAPKNFDCSKPSFFFAAFPKRHIPTTKQGLYGWWRCRSCLVIWWCFTRWI